MNSLLSVSLSTIRCLGGLSGSMLLGMTRDELKVVCPEEGGRVYYQLQNVKSALAVSSHYYSHTYYSLFIFYIYVLRENVFLYVTFLLKSFVFI